MELHKNPVNASQNILDYSDIDDTLDEFIKYFKNELIPNIPDDAIGNKRLFAKHAIDLYRSKGSDASYKLLFRMLFGEDITIYYPDQDILRVSDGRWVKETSIRLGKPSTGNLDNLEGQVVTGLSSGATATIDRVVRTLESGLLVREAFLVSIDGLFQDGEIVTNNKTGDSLITGFVISFTGTLVSIDPINTKGQGHQVGDRVSISSTSGSGATGTIFETSSNSAIGFTVGNPGSGYRVGGETVFVSGPGTGAIYEIASIVNTEFISINTDTIDKVKDIILNTGSTFVSAGANTQEVSASFAASNVSSNIEFALAFSNTTIGGIGTLTTISSGSGYDTLPTSTVIDDTIFRLRIPDGNGGYKGKNSSINVNYLPGAIERIVVDTPGAGYNKDEDVVITNITRNAEDARGAPQVTGVTSYPGKYTDTKGFISWNPKLQDNFYYQKFSYVINTDRNIKEYKRFVDKIIHPSGTKLFGGFKNHREFFVNNIFFAQSNTINQFTRKYTPSGGYISVTNDSQIITPNDGWFFNANSKVIIESANSATFSSFSGGWVSANSGHSANNSGSGGFGRASITGLSLTTGKDYEVDYHVSGYVTTGGSLSIVLANSASGSLSYFKSGNLTDGDYTDTTTANTGNPSVLQVFANSWRGRVTIDALREKGNTINLLANTVIKIGEGLYTVNNASLETATLKTDYEAISNSAIEIAYVNTI